MKFIPFMIKFSAIFIFLDFYFLIKLRKYVKDNGWNSAFYIIPTIISIFMLFITFENVWIQVADYVPSSFEKILFTLTSFWYLPKALIVLPMIFYDSAKILNKIYKKEENIVSKRFTQIINFTASQFSMLNLFIDKFLRTEPSLQSNINVSQGTDFHDASDYSYEKNYMENTENNNANLSQTIDISGSRRKFLRNTSWALAGVPFIIVGKGVFDTRYDFKVHESVINIPKMDKALDGLRIIQISDIHSGSFQSAGPIEIVRGMINDLKADAIVITGDFVNFNPDEYDMAIKEFKALKSDIGIYGCLGNHDHFMSDKQHEILKEKIRFSGIDLLVNESRTLTLNGAQINIAGNDNSGYGQFHADFDKTLSECNPDAPTILLCHDPTNWDKEIRGKRNVDLMLSGHTHGGQIGLEIWGDIVSPARIAYNQFAGHYLDNEQHLYINRGLGTTGPPVRVGVNPEITILTLKSRSISI